MQDSVDEKLNNLELKFDPRTIKHLGVQMYQTLPPVLAELISNSYDANATWVKIIFKNNNGTKQIDVLDNGDGMSFEDIKNKFLVIGKNRREALFIIILSRLIMSTMDILKTYDSIVDSVFVKVETHLTENQKLAELRDWLLPTLMNGQVTVKD